MRLIHAPPSPYGRKIAIALKEKQIAFETYYDQPWGDTTCTVDYSPLEQLPILVLDTGKAIYDSTYILEWLELRYPEPPLLPTDVDGILGAKLLQMLGERVMEAVHQITFELKRSYPSEDWVSRQTRKVRKGLDEIDRLVCGRCPAVGDAITVGDIAVGSTVLVFDFLISNDFAPDLEVLRWRHDRRDLETFIGALENRQSFQETKPAMMDVDLQAVVC